MTKPDDVSSNVSAHTYFVAYSRDQAPAPSRGCLWLLVMWAIMTTLMLIGTFLIFTALCVVDVWCLRYGAWVLGLL